jgi:hypothetical protein
LLKRSRSLLCRTTITAQISKRSGNIVSLKYRGLDLLDKGQDIGRFGGAYPYGRITSFGSVQDSQSRSIEKQWWSRRRGYLRIHDKESATDLPATWKLLALSRSEHWVYVILLASCRLSCVFDGRARYAVKLNPDI